MKEAMILAKGRPTKLTQITQGLVYEPDLSVTGYRIHYTVYTIHNTVCIIEAFSGLAAAACHSM